MAPAPPAATGNNQPTGNGHLGGHSGPAATPTIHEGARALWAFDDVRAAGGPMAALAAWVAMKEAEPAGKITDPAADCVARAAEAFAAMHGRAGNHTIDAALADNPGVGDLVHALGGTPAAVGRPETIRNAVASTPGSAALVITQPQADRAHVYWLVADDRGGGLTLRWVDTQRPGTFAEGASNDRDWWAQQLESVDTSILLFDPAGRPTTADALLNTQPRTRAPADRTVEAVLDPSTGPRRHGALPTTVNGQHGTPPAGSASTTPPANASGGEGGSGETAGASPVDVASSAARPPSKQDSGTVSSTTGPADSDKPRRLSPWTTEPTWQARQAAARS